MYFDLTNPPAEGYKWCPKCRNYRPRSEFCKEKKSADGRGGYCAPCKRAHDKAYRDSVKYRQANLKKLYGMTEADYQQKLTEQGGRCAICREMPTSGRGKKLYVDHCHASNEVRGLLCHACNMGLGHFKDDTQKLMAAAGYVCRHRRPIHPSA